MNPKVNMMAKKEGLPIDDKALVKDKRRREKNRNTAKQSRIRKAEYIKHLESEVKRLNEMVVELQCDLLALKSGTMPQVVQAETNKDPLALPEHESPEMMIMGFLDL